jgi:hypothetical protein
MVEENLSSEEKIPRKKIACKDVYMNIMTKR